VQPSVYAFMGAAGGLGGFSRMTISLAVISMEITNNMYLLLPLMLVIMISKQSADLGGPSVYDICLEANPDVHLLEDSLSEDHILVLKNLVAHDICTADITVVRQFEKAAQIMKLLAHVNYAGFPIVDNDGRLVGLVTRARLVALLVKRAKDNKLKNNSLPIMRLSEAMPEVTHWQTPVARAFQHFRNSGLQHLCVVDDSYTLLGILTRTDMAKLCKSGQHGIEEVRHFIDAKRAALMSGATIDTTPQATRPRGKTFKFDFDLSDSKAVTDSKTTAQLLKLVKTDKESEEGEIGQITV